MSTAQQYRLVALVRWLNGLKKEILGMDTAQACALIWDYMAIDPSESKEDLQRLIYFAQPFGKDLQGFLTSQALLKDSDIYQPGAEKISLLTMHAAKGLEFPVVFIAGCEDGLIPYRRPANASADTDEERRLFYVAMTRAKERLIFSWARKRTLFGRTAIQSFSPFAQGIEKKLKENVITRVKSAEKKQEQLNLF
jgi:DNA helicase-2/ATP-dependent DNA helicase PcrA